MDGMDDMDNGSKLVVPFSISKKVCFDPTTWTTWTMDDMDNEGELVVPLSISKKVCFGPTTWTTWTMDDMDGMDKDGRHGQ